MPSSRDRPEIPSTATDLELLREFEPVVRFTSGEQFFPMDVERYVRACSLWIYHPDDSDEEVIPEGELTLERLAEPRRAPFGSVFYLRFVGPLSIEASARALAALQRLRRSQRYVFRAGLGRLARGGLIPRLLDALFSASLLLRGRVPKATAATAVLEYAAMQEREERYVYHGRVVRHGGWTVCQYWLFFAYNNWRSGFHGVNDHESDWELVSVYLYERDGRLVPEWVAFASHDFHGADLRRRWDDRTDLDARGDAPGGARRGRVARRLLRRRASTRRRCRSRCRSGCGTRSRWWGGSGAGRSGRWVAATTPSAPPSSTSPAATG